jgi:hypothetical protein
MTMYRNPPYGRLLFRAALLLAVSTTADAQSGRRGTAIPDRLAFGTRANIQALADSLDAERLPSFAILDKAAEGALKGADDSRILTAVRALASRLRSGRQLLGPRASDNELLAVSNALYAGVSEQAIMRLATAQRARDASVPLTSALSIVAELASSSVPADLALSSVEALLARGARDGELAAFRVAVDREIRGGVSPREATAEGLKRALGNLTRTPRTP